MLKNIGRFLTAHATALGWCAVAVVVGLNVWGLVLFQARRNPRVTLDRIAHAIRAHDVAAFETEVDVDSMAGTFYDQHILPHRIDDKTATIPGVRERETTAVARRLRRWVDTGNIDENERPRLTLLSDFVASAIERRSETIDWMSTSPTVSIADVTLTDRYGITAKIELKLVRTNGVWRLAEVTNVEELASTLRAKEQHRARPEARRPLD